jgi:hypothetical protein
MPVFITKIEEKQIVKIPRLNLDTQVYKKIFSVVKSYSLLDQF